MTRDQFFTLCPVCGVENYGWGAHIECQPYLSDDSDHDYQDGDYGEEEDDDVLPSSEPPDNDHLPF